jgi:tetratricopeptide (TPR) repeat protein
MSANSLATVLLIAVFCGAAGAQEAAILKEGDAAFAQGDYDAARESFAKALQLARDSSARYEVLKRLTSTCAATGKFADAQRYLRVAINSSDPEYTADDQLPKLRSRGLSGKRSLAAREFALGIEALERFVAREPLRRVHECVFGVLALESEPVDPRL